MKKKVKELEKNGVFHSQWSALMSQTRSKIGLAIVLLFVAAAVFAPLIAPNDPLLVDVSHKLEGPSSTYWLGTDQLGRCIASRLLWGGRNSLLYGAIVLVITLLVGVPIGLISGYVGGKTDLFFMRVIDIFMAMPSFIVALAIAGTLGASGKNLVLSMSFVYWAGYARLSRALTIQVKEQNYMMALKAGGCGHTRIIFRHVLRNIAPSIIALATMEIGTIISVSYTHLNHRISVTQAQSALDAKLLADQGKNGAYIKRILEEESMDATIYIVVDTLEYLKKGGRITPAVSAIGSMLNLKPVLTIQGEKLDMYVVCLLYTSRCV